MHSIFRKKLFVKKCFYLAGYPCGGVADTKSRSAAKILKKSKKIYEEVKYMKKF